MSTATYVKRVPPGRNWSSIREAVSARVTSRDQVVVEIDRPGGYDVALGVKDRARVRELAEVLTPEATVRDMLDLIGAPTFDVDARVLEPACGNGNFLVEILARKLIRGIELAATSEEFEFNAIRALAATYGIDIDSPNVRDARLRMRELVVESYGGHYGEPRPGFLRSVDYVLKRNLIMGDTLNGPAKIEIAEFSFPAPALVTQRFFKLADLLADEPNVQQKPTPFKVEGARHYLELGNGNSKPTN